MSLNTIKCDCGSPIDLDQTDWCDACDKSIFAEPENKDIRYITFGCNESIHLFKKEGGYNPTYPYKAHNNMDEAKAYLVERGVTDIKIIKHYDE
jgi:hypothetical protein